MLRNLVYEFKELTESSSTDLGSFGRLKSTVIVVAMLHLLVEKFHMVVLFWTKIPFVN